MARRKFSMRATTRQGSTGRRTIPARPEHTEGNHHEPRRAEALGGEASSSVSSVMGPPNRAPGLNVMGGPDRGVRPDVMGPSNRAGVEVMGGPDRGVRLDVLGPSNRPGVDVMGGPDRGVRLDVTGHSDPRVEESLLQGSHARRLAGGQGPDRAARPRAAAAAMRGATDLSTTNKAS